MDSEKPAMIHTETKKVMLTNLLNNSQLTTEMKVADSFVFLHSRATKEKQCDK